MPWFRLDDSFDSHPKVIAAGNEAIGLYIRCGTYAARHLTDGAVSESIVLLYGSRALADQLVAVKLWHRVRTGWAIHDYLDYNPSREQVMRERKQAAERQRRRRDNLLSRRDSHRDSRVSSPAPTRPVPNTPQPPEPDGTGGQPLPEDHHGQHRNCRACGTSQRGPAPPEPPTPAARHPSARSVGEAARAGGLNGGRPASEHTVRDIAAQARAAITRENA